MRSQTARLVDADGAAGDQFGQSVAVSSDAIIVGAWSDDVGAGVEHGSATIAFAPAALPPPAPPAAPPFPAKLEVLRAQMLSSTRRLDVLAPITSRASGRVNVSLQAAGRTTRFTAPVDAKRARVRIDRRTTTVQARLGSGILTIAYPGDADTQPQVVRLRVAARHASLRAGRPQIAGRRGVVHSYTLFTGYRPARMRGEMASFQVLAAPG